MSFSFLSSRPCVSLFDNPEIRLKDVPQGAASILVQLTQADQEYGGQEVPLPKNGILPAGALRTFGPCNPGVYQYEVTVKSAKLQSDRKTVFLEIPKIHPVMQMRISVHINGADGKPIECEVDETINHVPGSSAPPVLTSPLPPVAANGAK